MPSREHDDVVTMLRSASSQSFTTAPSVEEARAQLDFTGAMFPVPEDVSVEAGEIAGRRVEWYSPTAPLSGRVLVYFHGGGYFAGSIDSHRSLVARMSKALNIRAVSVDYRLAPEFPFPAGLDDAVAVIDALVAQGTLPHEIIVGGDSAGGGLATALLMRQRDDDGHRPAGAILLSPWLDLTGTSDAMETVGEKDPMLNPDRLRLAADAYAGDQITSPLASPIFGDAHGLPPILVFAGTLDILVDDTRTFVAAAQGASVDIEAHVEDGLMHVWPFVDGLPEATIALEQMARWYQRHFAA